MTKKIFLRTAGILLLILTFLNSCRQEILHLDNEANSNENKPIISVLNQEQVENDKALFKKISDLKKNKFNQNFSARTVQDSLLDGAVIETNKVLLIEDGDKKTYTFPVSRTFPNNKIENLILKKNADNSYSGLLAQYTITEQQRQQFLDGNPINLNSNAKFYRIDNINISARVQTDVVGCLTITWETGYCASGQHNSSNAGDCELASGVPEPKILSIEDTCQLGSGGGGSGGSTGGGSTGGGDYSGSGGGGGSTTPTSPYNTFIFMSYDDTLLFCPQDDTYCTTNWANQVNTVNLFNSLGRNSVLSSYNLIFFAVKNYLVANNFSYDSQLFITERLNIVGNWYRVQDNSTDEKTLHNFKIANWILNLFLEDDTTDIQNFFIRVTALENALDQNPNKLLNIPCSELDDWQDVAQHQVPQTLKNKLNNIQGQTNWWNSWEIQNIDNAAGPSINMDLFPIKISTMPNKPNSTQKYTPAEFFDYFRKNINLFVDPTKSQFFPIVEPTYGINETNLWNSNNPLGSLVTIEIPGDDGTVMCTGYNGVAWVFTTIKAPYKLDGVHPVSGNRLFGYWVDNNNHMFIFTRGVDRFTKPISTSTSILPFLVENFAFSQADILWNSMQTKVAEFVNKPENGGLANKLTPVTYRPAYSKIKNYLKGTATIQSLGCN